MNSIDSNDLKEPGVDLSSVEPLMRQPQPAPGFPSGEDPDHRTPLSFAFTPHPEVRYDNK